MDYPQKGGPEMNFNTLFLIKFNTLFFIFLFFAGMSFSIHFLYIAHASETARAADFFDSSQEKIILGRLKYSGGGDWYNDPDALKNLAEFVNKNSNLSVSTKEKTVTLESNDLFKCPFVFMTGHDNVRFSPQEIRRLRLYLEKGGFLYIDDDYGLDTAVRRELKKLYPEKKLALLPLETGIFNCFYDFPAGFPKIHEHRPGPPEYYGLFVNGRLAVFYSYNTNISDGWPDKAVHNNPEEVRLKALKSGLNILLWSILQ
jgi:hypothetical protein